MTAKRAMTKRLAGFAVLPFLSMVVPFLFLPILARVAGADAWLAVAIGQSAGAFFALVVALGFNLVGPTLVSVVPPSDRRALFRTSVQARAVLFLPSAVIAFAMSALLAPTEYQEVAGLMALAICLTGLSSAWFMIGLGRAGLIALYEILPKVVATVAASIVVLAGAHVIWYPALLIVSSLTSLSVFWLRTVPWRELVRFDVHDLAKMYRSNASAAATEVAGGAYVALTVTFVASSTTAPQAAAYVSGDKLYKLGQSAVGALGNALQGWVVDDDARHLAARLRRSFLAHTALGTIGLALFVVAGPFLSELLFGPAVAIDQATANAFGVATLMISLNTSLGRHALISLGGRRAVLISVVIGAAIGVPSVLLLSAQLGAAGGAWGLAISEFTVAAIQFVAVVQAARRQRRRLR
jgi:O-antigen/teichoic acid export membrane protein